MVKVIYGGTTRRAKMPLRDTCVGVLEEQLRAFLVIPDNSAVTIERYSDSAGTYIILDPKNTSVYKQLYRAAKAKSKLKLRVTLNPDENESSASIPLNEEHLQESSDSGEKQPPSPQPQAQPEEAMTTSSDENATPSQVTQTPPFHRDLPARRASLVSKTYESSVLAEAARIAEASNLREELHARLANMGDPSLDTETPDTRAPAPAPAPAPAVTTTAVAADAVAASADEPSANFAICCNLCRMTTTDVHYHCSTCEDGDFDLCQACVDKGRSCSDSQHWLIKRNKVDGQIVTSTTERVCPKFKAEAEASEPTEVDKLADLRLRLQAFENRSAPMPFFSMSQPDELYSRLPIMPRESVADKARSRTCNGCVQELAESKFLHCDVCEDFDLCVNCFPKEVEGHHPKHAFYPLVPGSVNAVHITSKLAPGRNRLHHAICDQCDKFITGIRHKCLDCPDWDHCEECASRSESIHPGHRFVPIYEPVSPSRAKNNSVHVGVMCDGLLCSQSTSSYPAYIQGVRYKCAVCPDFDLCAACEAHPSNDHNESHPLIKIRTPIRQISVTTYGEEADGQAMPPMGDRPSCPAMSANALSFNRPQTVVDTKPQPSVSSLTEKQEAKIEKEEPQKETAKPAAAEAPVVGTDGLLASFVRDSVPDGTIIPIKQEFLQTWELRNTGETAWPAGCSVRFVGGDYMGHVDSSRPARTAELLEASESNTCNVKIQPGEQFSFTVRLRAPPRPGKAVSYWRATTPDGTKFGDRLWCDVNVRSVGGPSSPKMPSPAVEEKKAETQEVKEEEPELASSRMIFPKLETESPMASVHEEDNKTAEESEAKSTAGDGSGSSSQDYEWDVSDGDFLTDEEYDILDASDEEFLEEQRKNMRF
ncbi:next to BRCA1 1 protein [Geosmithia morbida]|uniref:Next to BRCA1 1 protein n=1 Tax=Geosmithia morbida TaxID=1094350 RepID=A0A9P4YYY9_9HYPO|nr:next to BRCA1 1 protein [Geosmithia morbida]KAF4125663.1 next to BRCA1 1 protein [Geosmithia morbida]